MPKTTIQIEERTREKLKKLGSMEDTYDSLLEKLMQVYEQERRKAHFVETQHAIAREGKFSELD